MYTVIVPLWSYLAHDKPGRFRASDNLANNDDARFTTNTLVSVSAHVSLPPVLSDFSLYLESNKVQFGVVESRTVVGENIQLPFSNTVDSGGAVRSSRDLLTIPPAPSFIYCTLLIINKGECLVYARFNDIT